MFRNAGHTESCYGFITQWENYFFLRGSPLLPKTFLNVTFALYYAGNQGGLYIPMQSRVSRVFPECVFFNIIPIDGAQLAFTDVVSLCV